MVHLLTQVPRRSFCCSRGEESLVRSTEFYSLLILDKKGKLLRKDFCPSCWSDKGMITHYSDAIAHWHVQKKSYPTHNPVTEKIERALAILQEALEDPSDRNVQKAFLLAQFLVRQGRFVLRKTGKGEEPTLYEDLVTEEVYALKTIPIGPIPREEWILSLHEEIRSRAL